MTQPSYTIASFDAAQLHGEIAASALIATAILGINADATTITIVFAVDPLPTAERTALDAIVAAHVPNTITFGKNYQEKAFGKSGRLDRETWWNVDNGDDTYSGKIEETIYAYSGSKSSRLLSETFTVYTRLGTIQETSTHVYKTIKASGGVKILVRSKQ